MKKTILDQHNDAVQEGVGGQSAVFDLPLLSPDGLSDLIGPILENLTAEGVSRSKQEAAILGIVERLVLGQPFDTADFWDQPGMPNRRTFHKWRAGDPAFQVAEDEARKAALSWRSEQTAERVQYAFALLQASAPQLVVSLLKTAVEGRNEFARNQASQDLLNRITELNPVPQSQVSIGGLDNLLEKIWAEPAVEGPETASDDTPESDDTAVE